MKCFKFLFLVFLISASLAETTPQESEAIVINGHSIAYDTKNNTSTVVGNARAERGAGDQKHILTANRFDVHFKKSIEQNSSESGSMGGSDIEKIEATGDAILIKAADKLTVKADYCFYRAKDGRDPSKIEFIECQGNVKLNKDKNYLEGDKAVINMNTGVYNVTSNKRVRGILSSPARKA